MSDIQCVFESMTSKGSIYISNYAAAQDISLLQAKGIKAVLSVARSGFVQHSRQDIPYYLYLPAEDHEQYQLYKFFNQTFEFIEQALHCMAGISRSVTIVIAYLLKKFKCSLGEVISMLQRRRNKINPNKGFIEQLKEYAQQQGLKCNFDYEQVPLTREKSCSRGKPSKSKEKIKNTQHILTNPLAKKYQEARERKNAQKTAATKEDISLFVKNEEEIQKKLPQLPSPPKTQKIQQDLVQSSEKPLQLQISSQKKQSSSPSSQKKKMSIEEKITKVREKILKQEQKRRSVQKSLGNKERIDKENNALNFRATLQTKKGSNKHFSDYFSLYSKRHQVIINIEKSSPNEESPSVNEPHQFQAYFCTTEEKVCPRDYRAQQRTLYSKIQQKKAVKSQSVT